MCRSRALAPPPCAMSATLLRNSSTRLCIAALFATKFLLCGVAAVLRIFIGFDHHFGSSHHLIQKLCNFSADYALISVKQFAPDQHPSDLARAGADLIEFCVAQHAARRIIVGITIAAAKLDRIKRRACRS